MIRQATIADASRIAEILIFTKRVNYRKIFCDDKVSFGEMQVYPLAQSYMDNPDKLKGIGFLKRIQMPYDFIRGMVLRLQRKNNTKRERRNILLKWLDKYLFYKGKGLGYEYSTCRYAAY